MPPTPREIVDSARGWVGTRFHHQGRVKKTPLHPGGCDCIGLVAGVATELGMKFRGRPISEFDRTNYPRLPDGQALKNALDELFLPKETIEPGDLLLMRFERYPQHVGIASDFEGGLGLIHAYAQARKVVENRLDEFWAEKIISAYSLINT